MATITWNASTDSSWSGSTNWTPTSVPTSADDVVFNSTSVKDCTVDIDATINSLNITSAYTGFLKATSHTFTSSQNFLDVGTGRRDYGDGIRVVNNGSRLNLGATSSDITASNCALKFDGSGITVDWSIGSTFKNLTLGSSAAITLNGSVTPQLTDSTCPLILGQDSTFNLKVGLSLNLNGGGSYINLPTSYKFTGAGGGISFKGTSTNTVLTIPALVSSVTGIMNFDNSGADRTYNIYNFQSPTTTVNVKNSSSKAIYNFLSDFTSGALRLGNSSSGTTTTFNFNSGTFDIRGSYSSGLYTSSNDGTFNFSNSKWFVQGNWTDGSNFLKNEGTSSVTFTTNDAVISASGHNFYDTTILAPTKTISCSGDFTCHSLYVRGGIWSSAGVNVVASGDVTFDNTANSTLGTGLQLTGNNAVFLIGSSVGTMTAPSCTLTLLGTGQIVNFLDTVTFKTLSIGPLADATIQGSSTPLFDSSNPCIMGLDSTLSINTSDIYFRLSSSGGTIFSLPARYLFKGSTSIMRLVSYGQTTMPGLRYSGNSQLLFTPAVNDTTVNLMGPLELLNSSQITIQGTSGYRMAFNTNNYDITASSLNTGNQSAGGPLTINYGSSKIIIGQYLGNAYQALTTYENFSTSNWTVSGTTWSFGTNHIIDPGTSVVSFTSNSAVAITTLGYSFYDLNLGGTGAKTITGNLVAHNFIQTAGTFSISGSTTLSGLANLTSAGANTFSSTLTFNAPTTEFTINNGGSYSSAAANINFNGSTSTIHCYNSATFRTLTLASGVNLLVDGSHTSRLGFANMVMGNDSTFTYNNASTGYVEYSITTGSFFTFGTNTLFNGTAPGDGTTGVRLFFNNTTTGCFTPQVNFLGTSPWLLTCQSVGAQKFYLNGDLNIGLNRLTMDGYGATYDTSGFDVTCGDIHMGFTAGFTTLHFRDSTINCTLFDATYKAGTNLTNNFNNSKWNVGGSVSFPSTGYNFGTSTFNFIGNSNINSNNQIFYDVTCNAPSSKISFINGNPLKTRVCHLVDGTLAFSALTTVSEHLHVGAGASGSYLNFNPANSLITKHFTFGGGDPAGTLQMDFGTGSMFVNGDVNPTVYEDGTKNVNFYRSNWFVHGNWTFPLNCNATYGWSKFTFDASNGVDSTITSNGHYFNWVNFGDATGRKIVLADDFICREAKVIDATVVKTGKYTEAWDNIRSPQVLGYNVP